MNYVFSFSLSPHTNAMIVLVTMHMTNMCMVWGLSQLNVTLQLTGGIANLTLTVSIYVYPLAQAFML